MEEGLKHHFKTTDLGSAQFVLGVEIKRRLEGGFFLVQEKCVSKVVMKFGMAEAKVVATLFEPGSRSGMEEVQEQEGADPRMADVSYKSLI